MASPQEQAKQMRKFIQDQKRLADAQRSYNTAVRGDENERIDYTKNLERAYKPLVDTMKPIGVNIEGVREGVNQNQKMIENVTEGISKSQKMIDITNKSVLQGLKWQQKTKQDMEDYHNASAAQFRHLQLLNQGINPDLLAMGDAEPPTETIQQVGSIAKRYILMRGKDSMSIRYDDTEAKFYLGNSLIDIKGNDLNFDIDGRTITGTEGLWALLTLSKPPSGGPKWLSDPIITIPDSKTYCRLIELTGACKTPTGKRRSSKNSKYVEIIKPFLDNKQKEPTFRPRSNSADAVSGSGFNSTVRFLSSDINDLKKRLYVILGNIEQKHTNITSSNIHEASEILDVLKCKNQVNPITYNNIYKILSNAIVRI